jgi:hypothetical protein
MSWEALAEEDYLSGSRRTLLHHLLVGQLGVRIHLCTRVGTVVVFQHCILVLEARFRSLERRGRTVGRAGCCSLVLSMDDFAVVLIRWHCVFVSSFFFGARSIG